MTELSEEIRQLYAQYPSWLVTICIGLVIGFVVLGLLKVLRFGLSVVVTVALVAILLFAGWAILGG